MSIFRKSKIEKMQNEVIEENKELRDKVDTLKKERFEGIERERKRAELAQISASEYKSQLREAKEKIEKLEAEIQRQNSEIEMLEKKKNVALSEIEMMRIEGKEQKGEQ